MADSPDPKPAAAPAPEKSEAANWSEAWARAEAKAEAAEKGEKPKAPKAKAAAPKPAAKAEPEAEEEEEEKDSEEPATKPKPKPKAKPAVEESEAKKAKKADEEAEAEEPEAKPKAKSKAEAEEPEAEEKPKAEPEAEEEESEDEEPEAPKKLSPAQKQKQLESLAKELGYRLDGAAVTTDERVGFRAEKRRWREKVDATEADFQRKLEAADRYYEPALKAKQALEAGDYDAALVALGVKGGLSEANDKYIERQSGKDPRVSLLEKKLAETEARERQREEAERQERTKAEREHAERESVRQISGELASLPHFKALANNEWFARNLLKVQQQHWDGVETLTVEDAALEQIQLLRNDPRAKMAYEALQLAFGASKSSRSGRGAEPDPEELDDEPVDRSDDTSVRPGKLPTTLPKRKAAEASIRRPPQSEAEWLKYHTARMRQVSQSD